MYLLFLPVKWPELVDFFFLNTSDSATMIEKEKKKEYIW